MKISWKSETEKLTNAILEFTSKVDKLMLGPPSQSRGLDLACLLVELRNKAHDSEVLLKGRMAATERLMKEARALLQKRKPSV